MQRLLPWVQAVVLSLTVALVVPALTWAQATSIFPVSSDVATVKSDLLLWATALIGVALAIYAFRRVRGLVR
ncbi:MAG: hypothetical protein KGO52_11205 [Nitrospirota bacterium]|nr:hypothetical protein [Nitrospirota bacterium]MDE3118989.1 hypothetical protein [Nitrospirota bacterium]MDE3225634.1 hypothetical protein [Nitrospirota bacterium]MDE3243275.1 hypothetical protein [Nitrospirota bacterium]